MILWYSIFILFLLFKKKHSWITDYNKNQEYKNRIKNNYIGKLIINDEDIKNAITPVLKFRTSA